MKIATWRTAIIPVTVISMGGGPHITGQETAKEHTGGEGGTATTGWLQAKWNVSNL